MKGKCIENKEKFLEDYFVRSLLDFDDWVLGVDRLKKKILGLINWN